jgi:hypothetical protein
MNLKKLKNRICAAWAVLVASSGVDLERSERDQRARLALQLMVDSDGSLEAHARRELAYMDTSEDGPNRWMVSNLLDMVRCFGTAGHSGFSASFAQAKLTPLLAFQPLRPLMGAPDEWVHIGDSDGVPQYQNARCGHVFREGDGQAYDSEGVIFREPNGACFGSILSRVPITFPYTPKTVYADVPLDASDEDKRRAARDAMLAARERS